VRGGRREALLVAAGSSLGVLAWAVFAAIGVGADAPLTRAVRRSLAGASQRPKDQPMDHERARELLARERARVERELAELRVPPPDDELAHVDQHPADTATELYDRELEDSLRLRLEEELAAIERAEKRLEEGTYGLSVESGQPISDARLEAIPWAERTAEEQARYDLGA
jgi:DnaK suppressor protein